MTASPSSFAELALPAVTAAYSAAGTDSVDDPHHAIESLLGAVREHLGIQVGFVCEFGETTRTFRYVDTDADHANLMVGLEEALGSTLLRRCDQPPLPAGRLVAAIRVALAKIDLLPPGTFLAVNVSAGTLATRELVETLRTVDLDRIVIELTERVESADYVGLMNSLFALRQGGARLAVDDTGAGFDGLRHILQIGPDIIKLDLGVASGVGSDPVRQAMAYALQRFAVSTGAILVAEGIETSADLDALLTFGVRFGQGYYLGRPAALADIPRPARPRD